MLSNAVDKLSFAVRSARISATPTTATTAHSAAAICTNQYEASSMRNTAATPSAPSATINAGTTNSVTRERITSMETQRKFQLLERHNCLEFAFFQLLPAYLRHSEELAKSRKRIPRS